MKASDKQMGTGKLGGMAMQRTVSKHEARPLSK